MEFLNGMRLARLQPLSLVHIFAGLAVVYGAIAHSPNPEATRFQFQDFGRSGRSVDLTDKTPTRFGLGRACWLFVNMQEPYGAHIRWRRLT